MAVPNFLAGALNTDFRYLSTPGVVDVNTIISDLNTELTALGWTDTGGLGTGPWKSPTRADGVFIILTATRSAATRIIYVVNDPNGLQVNWPNATGDCRQDIDVAGTEIRYYTGKFHVCVDSVRPTPECFWAAIMDHYPDALGNPSAVYMTSRGPRSAAGTLQGTCEEHYGMPITASNYQVYATTASWLSTRQPTTTSVRWLAFGGGLMPIPEEFIRDSLMMGRIPQALLVDYGQAFGAEITVPIDTGVTGVFKVVGLPSASQFRMMFRKA